MRSVIAVFALAFAGVVLPLSPVVAQAPPPTPLLLKATPSTVSYTAASTPVVLTGQNFIAGKTNAVVGTTNVSVTYISATMVGLVLTPALIAGGSTVTVTLSNQPATQAGRSMSARLTIAVSGAPAAMVTLPTTPPTPVPTRAPGSSQPGLTLGVSNPGPGGGSGGSGGGGTNITLTPTNGVPLVSTISPASAPLGSSFTLTLLGNNFSGNSVVTFGSVAVSAVSSSPTALTVVIPASAMTTAGRVSVSVSNPAPGGGTSAALGFTVTSVLNPTPAVANVSPTTIPAGSGAHTVTVTGSGFLPSTSASLGGVPGSISSGAITFNLPAAAVASAGTLSGIITNPSPGGGGASFSVNVLNGPPTVSGFAPNKANAGSPATAIQVSGSNFGVGSTITFDGTPIPTTFVSPTSLAGQLSASFLQSAGNFPIGVNNPAPGGGGAYGPGTFSITSALPTLTAVAPAQIQSLGTTGVTVTLSGTGFTGQTHAASGTTALAAVYASATSISVAIPSSLLQRAGTIPVTVTNPPPGGGTSAAINLSIANAIPTLTSVTPTSYSATQTPTLTITGTLFVQGATVNLAGSALPTTFVSATQLTAVAGQPAPVGRPAVTVTNPGPGGGTSNAVTIAVSSLVPTIATVTPASIPAGQTITITGTNFSAISIVLLGGTAIPTTVVSATQITATIPGSTTPGSVTVAVQNPATATAAAQTSTTITIAVGGVGTTTAPANAP